MDDAICLRRGLVLHTLHAQYPHALTRLMLEKSVKAIYEGDDRGLYRDLAYLEEKGLLKKEESQVAKTTYHAYRISPAGIDVVEGATEDPGIMVERG